MKVNLVISTLFLIILMVSLLDLLALYIKKKNQKKIVDLKNRKNNLFNIQITEKIKLLKKMHLIGRSQSIFRKLNNKWEKISKNLAFKLKSQIFEIENLNGSYKFFKAKVHIIEVEKILSEKEQEFLSILQKFKNLHDTEKENSIKIQKGFDLYQTLKNNVETNKKSYGSNYSEIQKKVKNTKNMFTRFFSLNASGDPIEAFTFLKKAETCTYELEKLVNDLPEILQKLNKVFPSQVEEIQNHYKKMIEKNYIFPKKISLLSIDNIAKKIENLKQNIFKFELFKIESEIQDIEKNIDIFYSLIEKELHAKKYVMDNCEVITKYIAHTIKNNYNLSIDIDHISQHYILNYNEVDKVKNFKIKLEDLNKKNKNFYFKFKNKKISSSEVQSFYQSTFKVLNVLQNQQIEINDSIQKLPNEETNCKEKLKNFELEMKKIKRLLEKSNLPGISKKYLTLFFNTKENLSQIFKCLNKVCIDIEEICKLINLFEKDIKNLKKSFFSLTKFAFLAEQMIQYSNQYYQIYPQVKTSRDIAIELFFKKFAYEDALDEISKALELVDPGLPNKIENLCDEINLYK